MGKTYFKYRSLDNLERFLQIIMNRELYGALYQELNDPMEGYFSYNPTINPEIRRKIYHDRANTYICSASRKHNIGIMWSHYADEHRGCCIEFSVTSKWANCDIDYSNEVPYLDESSDVKDILRIKSPQWKYDEEVRFFKTIEPNYMKRPKLKIKIIKIWLGKRVYRSTVSFIKKLVSKIDNSIEVEKITDEKLDYGYQ